MTEQEKKDLIKVLQDMDASIHGPYESDSDDHVIMVGTIPFELPIDDLEPALQMFKEAHLEVVEGVQEKVKQVLEMHE